MIHAAQPYTERDPSRVVLMPLCGQPQRSGGIVGYDDRGQVYPDQVTCTSCRELLGWPRYDWMGPWRLAMDGTRWVRPYWVVHHFVEVGADDPGGHLAWVIVPVATRQT